MHCVAIYVFGIFVVYFFVGGGLIFFCHNFCILKISLGKYYYPPFRFLVFFGGGRHFLGFLLDLFITKILCTQKVREGTFYSFIYYNLLFMFLVFLGVFFSFIIFKNVFAIRMQTFGGSIF